MNWIEVSERLPEYTGIYLIFSSWNKTDTAFYNQDGKNFSWPYSSEITHWQPLPEPPTEADDLEPMVGM